MTSFPADMPVSQGRDTARGNPDTTESDYRALGAVVKGMTAQVVFSSMLLVRRSQQLAAELVLVTLFWVL